MRPLPELAHRNLDWQRNDRLGRIRIRQSKYDQLVGDTAQQPGLTAHTPTADVNCNADSNCYSNAYSYPTPTATPTPTPRPALTPRPRPTPAPRP